MDHERLQRLRNIGKLLDSQFQGPGGFRFGLDAILGLIPFVGDFVTSAASLYIIAEAGALGASVSTLVRMAFNVAVENIVDMVPLLGNIFDFVWKANNKNIALLEKHIHNPRAVKVESRIFVTVIILVLIGFFVLTAVLAFYVLRYFYDLIVGMNLFGGGW
ncbi:MAG: DUF4112 domain-containing protein [Bdellovibrionota bacterium]